MSKDLSKFSLLLPIYMGDSENQFLRAFLSSTSEQTLPPSEVVLVQDGPVSESLEAVVKHLIETSATPVVLVRLEENRGLVTALNSGIAAAKHELIARMDADDISLPERFEKQIPLFLEEYDLVGSAIAEFEDDETKIHAIRPVVTEMAEIIERAKFRSPFNHPTVVYKKSAVLSVGGYLEMGSMEDYWLWIRMLKSGLKTANLPEPLVKYRLGSGAYQRRGGKKQWQSEKAIQKAMHEIGFISKSVYFRNIVIRGIYRFIPTPIRKLLYKKAFTN